MKIVFSTTIWPEFEMVKSVIEGAGIKYTYSGDKIGHLPQVYGPLNIFVDELDVEIAKEAIRNYLEVQKENG